MKKLILVLFLLHSCNYIDDENITLNEDKNINSLVKNYNNTQTNSWLTQETTNENNLVNDEISEIESLDKIEISDNDLENSLEINNETDDVSDEEIKELINIIFSE